MNKSNRYQRAYRELTQVHRMQDQQAKDYIAQHLPCLLHKPCKGHSKQGKPCKLIAQGECPAYQE